MNEYEEKKFNTIKKLEEGELTRKEASYELNLSLKQIDRLRVIYRKDGAKGFIHKNRGNIPINKIKHNIIKELEQLYLTEYYDYNFEAFYDELNENEKYKGKYDISYSTLYNRFLNDDIISPIAHKETIRLYNEKMNKSIDDKQEIQVYQ